MGLVYNKPLGLKAYSFSNGGSNVLKKIISSKKTDGKCLHCFHDK